MSEHPEKHFSEPSTQSIHPAVFAKGFLDLTVCPPDETEAQRLVRLTARLMQLRVSNRQIGNLLAMGLDLVERQLNWLPYRNARKKASLIVKAIEEDYEAPANWEADED